MSFRTRLTLVAMTTLALGLGALLVIGNVLLDRRVDDETSNLLSERATALSVALVVSDHGVHERKTVVEEVLERQSWVFSGGKVIERPAEAPAVLDAAATALKGSTRVREVGGPGETRLRAQPVRAPSGRQVGTIVIAQSTAAVHDLQKKVVLGSVVVFVLILLAGWLAIRRAISGALRPVVDMTEAVADWGTYDLDRRFGLGPPRDELTGLAATLDGLLGRIAASRRHEQRLASEVAHELRTPLARLRGTADLALRDDDHAEREAALRAVADETGRMGETIDTLLTAARQELGPMRDHVDVAAVVRELDDVEVTLPRYLPPGEGDADLLRRALAPLVDNARRHAREQVSVAVDADDAWVRVTVRDDGPGLSEELREQVFEPGVQGTNGGGAGLGLPLARRLARTCGGDVRAGGGPGGCFVLTVPRAD